MARTGSARPLAGQPIEEAFSQSIRAKVLEFERERVAYIEAMRDILAAPPAEETTSSKPRTEGDQDESSEPEGDANEPSQGKRGGGGTESERRIAMAACQRMRSLRVAREEWYARSEEIRLLQQRKADAAVRFQGERLSNLEQELELGVLRLERLLDRERILELLRLTDPDRPLPDTASETLGNEGYLAGADGMVPEDVIDELEDRAAAAEERARAEASKLGLAIAGRLGERSKREEHARREASTSREEVLHLQSALRDKEDRLARTVVDYLELRHAMLQTQRVASEARQEALAYAEWQEEEVRRYKSDVAERRRVTKANVDKACEALGKELRRQIRLREDEACMLVEQHAETKQLYESRAKRLEGLLEDWKSKHAALRRRFALETEGFRREADEIGRRFEKVRAGPPRGHRKY